MKLQAKARPVQINKLKLGGKEINTKEDLLQNFYLSEIIDLGNKFTQWIRRNGEMHTYSEQIDSIFKVRNKEKIAHDLLYLFFPMYNGKSLLNVLYNWYDNKKNINLLKSLLYCMNSSESLATDLMERFSDNKSFIVDWVEDCSEKIFLSSDFCYKLGVFFKGFNDDKSIYWLNKAAENGSESAALMLKENDGFNIKINGVTLDFIRVKSYEGDFFIAKYVLTNSLLRNWDLTTKGEDFKNRADCNFLLEELSDFTGLIWRYPTFEQWTLANNTNMLDYGKMAKGEWCEDKMNSDGNVFRVANYGSKWLPSDKKSYLRPVLIVKENPKLS